MENPDIKKKSVRHQHKSHTLLQSTNYALAGIAHTLMTQRNMKLHVLAALGVLLSGLIFPFTQPSKALILLCIGLVLFAELMNTAMEAIVDLYTGETHRLAQVAKDAAAGGVMVLSACSMFVFLGVLVAHQEQIFEVSMLLEKLTLVSVIIALQAMSLFVWPGRFWPLFVQGIALIFMVLIAVTANEPIFSSAAFLLMALISFAPVIVKKNEQN